VYVQLVGKVALLAMIKDRACSMPLRSADWVDTFSQISGIDPDEDERI
jgi:hypothetical protein